MGSRFSPKKKMNFTNSFWEKFYMGNFIGENDMILRKEQMRKDITNDESISSFLDKIVENPLMKSFSGVLTAEKSSGSVIIMLDAKRMVEIPYEDMVKHEGDMVNEVCCKIQLDKNMNKFIWYCLDILSDMIESSYGDMISLKRKNSSLLFRLKKDEDVHLITLKPDEFNTRVFFDNVDTDILIPDLTGEYFDYNTCYMNHDVSYDENCIDQLIMNYLQ